MHAATPQSASQRVGAQRHTSAHGASLRRVVLSKASTLAQRLRARSQGLHRRGCGASGSATATLQAAYRSARAGLAGTTAPSAALPSTGAPPQQRLAQHAPAPLRVLPSERRADGVPTQGTVRAGSGVQSDDAPMLSQPTRDASAPSTTAAAVPSPTAPDARPASKRAALRVSSPSKAAAAPARRRSVLHVPGLLSSRADSAQDVVSLTHTSDGPMPVSAGAGAGAPDSAYDSGPAGVVTRTMDSGAAGPLPTPLGATHAGSPDAHALRPRAEDTGSAPARQAGATRALSALGDASAALVDTIASDIHTVGSTSAAGDTAVVAAYTELTHAGSDAGSTVLLAEPQEPTPSPATQRPSGSASGQACGTEQPPAHAPRAYAATETEADSTPGGSKQAGLTGHQHNDDATTVPKAPEDTQSESSPAPAPSCMRSSTRAERSDSGGMLRRHASPHRAHAAAQAGTATASRGAGSRQRSQPADARAVRIESACDQTAQPVKGVARMPNGTQIAMASPAVCDSRSCSAEHGRAQPHSSAEPAAKQPAKRPPRPPGVPSATQSQFEFDYRRAMAGLPAARRVASSTGSLPAAAQGKPRPKTRPRTVRDVQKEYDAQRREQRARQRAASQPSSAEPSSFMARSQALPAAAPSEMPSEPGGARVPPPPPPRAGAATAERMAKRRVAAGAAPPRSDPMRDLLGSDDRRARARAAARRPRPAWH